MSFSDFCEKLINPRVNGYETLPPKIFKDRIIKSYKEIPKRFGNNFKIITNTKVANEFMKHLYNHSKKNENVFEELGIFIDNNEMYVDKNKGWDIRLPKHLLPYVARTKIIPFLGDIIPSTSWGSSLSNLLTKSSWNKLMALTFEQNNHSCELCGSTKKLSCHEKWRYLPPLNNDVRYLEESDLLCDLSSENPYNIGVQRLSKLMSLCQDCHDINHLDIMEERDELQKGLELISDLTRMDARDTSEYYDYVNKRLVYHNQYQWVMDLSYINDIYPSLILEVNKNWVVCESNESYIENIYGSEESMQSLPTRLLGVNWKLTRGMYAFGYDDVDELDAMKEMAESSNRLSDEEDFGLGDLLDFDNDMTDLPSVIESNASMGDIDESHEYESSDVIYSDPTPYYIYEK